MGVFYIESSTIRSFINVLSLVDNQLGIDAAGVEMRV